MIEHLLNHPLGLVHVFTALAAITLGAAVIFNRKGTQRHRWIGRGYLISMLIMCGTALAIFELSGQFGPFHWLALVSFVSVLAVCPQRLSPRPVMALEVGWGMYSYGFEMKMR